MLNGADADHLNWIRTQSQEALRDAIGEATDVAVLDVPNQRNVGDSLIWMGERSYLSALGLRVQYAADLRSYEVNALRKALPAGGVVLLHGGGNFGDLWLGHQVHRERIARELRDYRIVQLPQSIYFRSEARAAEADTAIGSHPDFVLLVRDTPSIERAAQLLPSVDTRYCPDMALGWDPPARSQSAEREPLLLAIAREDREGSSGLSGVVAPWLSGLPMRKTDWSVTGMDAVRWKILRAVASVLSTGARARNRFNMGWSFPPNRLLRATLQGINDVNVESALDLYSPATIMIVDRLHAHVLAALLGIEHVVLDNSYGKVSAIFQDYTGGFSTAHLAFDLANARDMLEERAQI